MNYFLNQCLSARRLFSWNAFIHCGFLSISVQNFKYFSELLVTVFFPGSSGMESAVLLCCFINAQRTGWDPEVGKSGDGVLVILSFFLPSAPKTDEIWLGSSSKHLCESGRIEELILGSKQQKWGSSGACRLGPDSESSPRATPRRRVCRFMPGALCGRHSWIIYFLEHLEFLSRPV